LNTAKVAGEGRREYLQRVNTEHDNIVSAIANHDPEAARAAMRTHLANSRERTASGARSGRGLRSATTRTHSPR